MSWPVFWYKKKWQSQLLWPLSKAVCWVAARRYQQFIQGSSSKPQRRHLAGQKPPYIIVVGNVVVGGTGKTPFIIWLVKQLQQAGLRVGIISRGYGSDTRHHPHRISASSQASQCGDEPLMLWQQLQCPVAVAAKRMQALQQLMPEKLDIVISDDGLQHYLLPRNLEIVLIDAQRQFGNQRCLPAGPLREPLKRIEKVDFTVWNGSPETQTPPSLVYQQACAVSMQLLPHCFRQVGNPETALSLTEFQERYPARQAIAIAGIGNPERFFASLEVMQFNLHKQAFADHYAYTAKVLAQLLAEHVHKNQPKPLIMTQKDAVKCKAFAKDQAHWWYLEVVPQSDQRIIDTIKREMYGS